MAKDLKHILVTGGAGYIGSHMVRLLLEKKQRPLIFDNLSTGHKEFIPKGVPFVKGDLRCPTDLAALFKAYSIEAVIHFAAAIVVPESVSDPLRYYENNITSTLNLLRAMDTAGTRRIVFSSSACVYGNPKKMPVDESEPFEVENPYGATKIMAEQILKDLAVANKVDYIALRYFNVAGAHPRGGIGIKMDAPTHLIPNVMMAAHQGKELKVFGTDYKTRDGSCLRDYIHVCDLCEAHLLAIKALRSGAVKNEPINLGSGRGFTVKEVIRQVEKTLKRKLPVVMAPRRPGDSVAVVASYKKAKRLLGWAPKRGLQDIIHTAYAWEQEMRG